MIKLQIIENLQKKQGKNKKNIKKQDQICFKKKNLD
jgi:hypothetical protein